MDKQIIVCEADRDHRIEVKTDGETVWLTQSQMCQLFGRNRMVITKYINNIFRGGELEREVVCAKFAPTTSHGPIKGKGSAAAVECSSMGTGTMGGENHCGNLLWQSCLFIPCWSPVKLLGIMKRELPVNKSNY